MNHKNKVTDVALRLRELRKNLKYTQAQMAEKLGISREMVIKLETGEQLPSGRILQALDSSFRLSFNWLFYGVGNMFLSTDHVDEEKTEEIDAIISFLISASAADKQLVIDMIKRLS